MVPTERELLRPPSEWSDESDPVKSMASASRSLLMTCSGVRRVRFVESL